jgi:hypothetical protein
MLSRNITADDEEAVQAELAAIQAEQVRQSVPDTALERLSDALACSLAHLFLLFPRCHLYPRLPKVGPSSFHLLPSTMWLIGIVAAVEAEEPVSPASREEEREPIAA